MVGSIIKICLVDITERYLFGQGRVTMRSCLGLGQMNHLILVEITDKHKWDSFVEGKIAKELSELVDSMINRVQ